MALPFGSPMYQMFEMLLIMYIDFPGKMNPGIFVTASDIIFLFDTEGNFNRLMYLQLEQVLIFYHLITRRCVNIVNIH